MTISVNQQVDFLWKKLGYGVAKTDIATIKDATNESIISSPFIPGDKIWVQTSTIPGVIPANSTPTVEVHTDANGSSSVQCTMDITATTNRTWLTGLDSWVPIEFGSTYLVKVYLDNIGSTTPQSTGIQLYGAGTNNDDEWFFDYEAGVLNFIGVNLPNDIFVGKHIFIAGARYIGHKGLNVLTSGTIGNITISGDTISSTGNIILAPTGNIIASGSVINSVGYPTLPTDAATAQYVLDSIQTMHPNTIWQGDSIVALSDVHGAGATLTFTMDGQLIPIATFTNTTAKIANLSIVADTISSSGNIELTPNVGGIVAANTNAAFKIPVGLTSDRPVAPEAGYYRFNSSLGFPEYFNGTDWVSPESQISSQTIIPDGLNSVFTLQQASHSENLLVTTNGVVQRPNVAYNVTGTQIAFNEVPLVTDIIEVRYISQSVTPVLTVSPTTIIDVVAVPVNVTPVVLDSFSMTTYRSAKYTLSITDSTNNSQIADVYVSHNSVNNAQYNVFESPMTGSSSTSITYNVYVSAGSCVLAASSSAAGTHFKIQKTYFTI